MEHHQKCLDAVQSCCKQKLHGATIKCPRRWQAINSPATRRILMATLGAVTDVGTAGRVDADDTADFYGFGVSEII